ncbi:MAG: hypothetical protein UZ09_BCD002001603 [Bacteroidetes bacterium OLB9]|nr:MAG: hypothetical protein UZ09_BCD002001603 [Bacteroidetes bacterium OLB9]
MVNVAGGGTILYSKTQPVVQMIISTIVFLKYWVTTDMTYSCIYFIFTVTLLFTFALIWVMTTSSILGYTFLFFAQK